MTSAEPRRRKSPLDQAVTPRRSLEQALVENLHREDLTPLEEAAAYQQLIEEFGWFIGKRVGLTELSFTKEEVEGLLKGIAAAASGKDSEWSRRDAAFARRDSLPGVIAHVTRDRGGAPLHFVLSWAVAHLGFGLGGLRLVSAAAAVSSLPLAAALGERLVGRRSALLGTALLAGSWLFLFHGVYARMYGVFLLLSLLTTLALLATLLLFVSRSL